MAEVTITEVSLISPVVPTERRELPFTTFDLMQKRDSMPYLQRVAFYPSYQLLDFDLDLIVSKLKLSLAEVLVHFYPFAGRIAFDQTESPFLNCNAQGVEFTVGTINVALDQINHSQYLPLFSELIKRGNYEETTMTGNAPFATFQVTKFICGSLALAWSYDHMAIDGVSMMHFLVSWSEMSKCKPLSVLPSHERYFEMENQNLAPKETIPLRYKFDDATLRVPVVCKIFNLDEADIEKLKSGTNFTTFEAVTAHLWIALCKARELPDSQVTKVYFAINCRPKLVPSLPKEYFGNVVLPGISTSTVGELISGGVHAAASAIKKTIEGFNMKEIQAQLEAYRDQKNSMAQGIDDGVDLFIGSSPRHPLYELDFGFGKPVSVRHARVLWNGFLFLDPSPLGGKNMDVTANITPKHMDKFGALLKLKE